MEARGCIALIRARMPQFRPSEAKIAKFVLANPEQALFMSALELTQQAGTSEATLVRFWRNLGYDSLFQFRLALARDWVRSTDEGNESGEELSYDSASGLISQHNGGSAFPEGWLSPERTSSSAAP
jgi:DNA-binding MurR/RpiR family transcriptional regulator